MMDDLLRILGLVLILEALLPFISPRAYRQAVAQIALTPDGRMRGIAFVILLLGLALWVWG
ncbi:MAG: DUF2065 domain-containing protein [Guyparkeria sp.]